MLNDPLRKVTVRSVLATLRIPDYRRLLISNGLWWQFIWMEQLVIGWLALELTNSAWLVAVTGFFRMAPLLVIGFVSASIADRFGRRRVILFSQSLNLSVPLVLLLLVATNQIQYWHLPAASVVVGAAWALDWPTRRSILPDLIGKERVTDGILLESVLQNVSRIIGPYAAGVIVAYWGVAGCFAALALLSGIALLILFRLSKPSAGVGESPEPPSRTSMGEAMRYILGNHTILGVLLVTTVMNFLFFPHMTLLPVFARDILGQGSVGLGLLGAGYGVGAFLGLIILNWIRLRWAPNWIYIAGSIYQAAILIPFAFSVSFPLSVALLTLAGLGQSSFAVLQSTIVLQSSSDELRGRTMGILNLTIGAGAIGRIQLGALAGVFGAPAALGVSCGAAVLLILATTAALPGFRRER